MTNFRLILTAMRVAKKGAQMRLDMGMSLGDNAYGDWRAEQLESLLENLGLNFNPLDENSIGWDLHCDIFHRFRCAFNRAIY